MREPSMRIFISYGRKDALEFARRLSSWLRDRGYDPWLDVENGIPPGTPFDIKIEDGIKESDLILALLSPESVRPGGFCRNELLYALSHNIDILPVRIADVDPPIQIISLNYLDASTDPESVFALLPAALDQITKKAYTWRTTPGAAGTWWEKIRVITFQEELKRYGGDFTGREWLFNQFDSWAAKKDSHLLLLTGEAGIGKSALSAQLTTRMDVMGIHFSSRSNPDSCRPESMISALIFQLAHQFPAYREIMDQITPPDASTAPEALFRMLVTDPLRACEHRLNIKSPWIFVVDGLDEATAGAGTAMVDFLIESVERFPSWFQVIATARPDRELLARFMGNGIQQKSLEASSGDNRKDVAEYIRVRVESEGLSVIPGVANRIDELAAGNFLYAETVIDALTDPEPTYRLTPDELGRLPPALGGLYDRMFRKRFPDITKYEQEVAPLVACLAVTRMPVPEPLLIAASGLDPRTATRGLRALSQFLTRDDDKLRLFHQSLIQWLMDDPVGNPFAVFPEEGNRRLAEAGLQEVRGGKRAVSEYTLFTLPFYLVEASLFDVLEEVLRDLRYIEGICNRGREEFLAIWSVVERSTPLQIQTVYAPVVETPSLYGDSFLNKIAFLLLVTGHLDGAMALLKEQERISRGLGNVAGLQASLGNQSAILYKRGDFDSAMKLLKEQERICRDLGNVHCLQRSLGNQALILQVRGDLDSAVKLLMEQERICRDLGNFNSLQVSLGNRATILYTRGDLDGAMALHKEKEQICRNLGNLGDLSISLGNQALILKVRGDLDGAMALHKEEEWICRDLGNIDGLQASLGNQALILKARGDLDGAMGLLKEQERICHELGNIDDLQSSLGNQATILYARGDLDGAMALHKEQERICRDLGNIDGLQLSLGNQALILQDRGDLDGAMELHKEEERICRELGNVDSLQRSLGNQALILYIRGDLDGAMALHKEEERICRDLGNINGLQASLGNQANILYARGNLDSAMKLLMEQERICRDLGNDERLLVSLGIQANILADRGDLGGAMALHREEEQICRDLGDDDSLQVSLANQALILQARGDLDGAMMLLKEQERICRDLGNTDGLQLTLYNQANILRIRGDLDGAMSCLKEQQRIYSELGNFEGLAISLVNQAVTLAQQDQHMEASRAVDEALAISSKGGCNTSLEVQIRKIKEKYGF
ncbi:TIR domain-containing protein [Methanosphaerula subterraneus]|uniref:TIR domain-containing protein n=1 Tax=Methanosphaerula subterraneus TaxID=3350244 RepID=UPI003F83C5B1